MKTIFLTVLIFSYCFCCAQTTKYDSLEKRVIKLESIANNTHQNMKKTARQMFFGCAVQVIGASLLIMANNSNNPDDAKQFSKMGYGTLIVGCVVNISALTHLERGGRKKAAKH